MGDDDDDVSSGGGGGRRPFYAVALLGRERPPPLKMDVAGGARWCWQNKSPLTLSPLGIACNGMADGRICAISPFLASEHDDDDGGGDEAHGAN